jgi:hypothetical protein
MLAFLHELAAIAPILTPFVAGAALLVAWRQLALNRANQRETTAKATFREFLKLTVSHPDLAEGRPSKSEDQERYKWFVGYFLWAVEEVLEYCPDDLEWIANLQMLANCHGPYFRSSDFTVEEYNSYSLATRKLIDRARASGAADRSR